MFLTTFSRCRAGIVRNGRVVGEHVQPALGAGHVHAEDQQLRTVQTQGRRDVVGRELHPAATGVHRELPAGPVAVRGRPPRRRAGVAPGLTGRARCHRRRRHVRRPDQATLRAVHIVAATATATGQRRRARRRRRRRRGPAGPGREGIAVRRRPRHPGTDGARREEQPGPDAVAQGLQQDRPSAKREYTIFFPFFRFL